jgi:hypothetical protein
MPRSRDFPLREESSATMRSIEGSGDIGVSTDETAENSKQFESRDSAAKFRQLRLRSRLDIVSFGVVAAWSTTVSQPISEPLTTV